MSGFFEGRLWRGLGFLANIFLINTMWLIGCIPVLTVGASTAAMLHTYLRLFDHREEPLHRLFWKGFTGNFKQATAVWAIYLVFFFDVALVLWTGRQTDRLSAWSQSKPLLALAVFLALLCLFTLHYIFAVIAYLDCTVQQGFINALGLSCRHLGTTLLMLLLSAACVPVVYCAPFMALILFGAVGALDSKLLLRVLTLHTKPPAEPPELTEEEAQELL